MSHHRLATRVLLAALPLAFAYGVGVGVYHWPPYSQLKGLQDQVSERWGPAHPQPGRPFEGDEELLRFAFRDPRIPQEQILPPIATLRDVYEANRDLFLPVSSFFSAYETMRLGPAVRLRLDEGATRVLQVGYELAGRGYRAHAYSRGEEPAKSTALLVIPGTGLNQSYGIYVDDPENYHFGLLELAEQCCDGYVLIKPNEDSLAFHRGAGKLVAEFLINWHLEHGGSYSASYIANSLAVTKYLQQTYERVVVAGLSQGGGAALLNALQSRVEAAIVSSGFSILKQEVSWASPNQIVIPGIWDHLGSDVLAAEIGRSPTRFLFTWGRAESGTYRIEAEKHLTCDLLAGVANVECGIHDGGHEFPRQLVADFLARMAVDSPSLPRR